MLRLALVASSCLLLAACETTGPIGSITKGECNIVHTPEFAVLGKAKYDQIWADKTIESLVRACRQVRPKKRPASFDVPLPKPRPVAVKTVITQPIPAEPNQLPKKGIIERIKEFFYN